MDIVTTSSDESDDDARETLAQKEREAEEAAEAARERELEAESILLDKQIEEEIRGRFQPSTQCALTFNPCAVEMTEEEKTSIFSAPEFLDFVEQSTKIIQRALNDNYDYVRDYTIGTETGGYVSKNSARRPLIIVG